jgi:uncharacterized metal-binding protein
MALYKTHVKFNIFFLPLILLFIFYFFKSNFLNLAIFSIAFIYSTFFMSPDLDLANQIKLFSIRGFFTLPFRFYSIFFKHRGISHNAFLGSLSRILWMGGFIYLIFYLLNKPIFSKKDLFKALKSSYFLYALFGVILSDFCHLILDYNKKK